MTSKKWLPLGALSVGLGIPSGILGAHTEGFWSGTFSGMSILLLCLAFYCLGRSERGS